MQRLYRQYAAALVTVAVASLLNLWLQKWIGYQAIALVYLLAIVLLALFVGRGPILLGTTLTAVGWSYLFAPPRFSFHISGSYDKMMLAMYFVVSLTVGQLTAQLRAKKDAEIKALIRVNCVFWWSARPRQPLFELSSHKIYVLPQSVELSCK